MPPILSLLFVSFSGLWMAWMLRIAYIAWRGAAGGRQSDAECAAFDFRITTGRRQVCAMRWQPAGGSASSVGWEMACARMC